MGIKADTKTQRREGKGTERKRVSKPRAELAALRTIGRALSSAPDLSTTLEAISATTTDVMRVDCCSIYLLDEAGQVLILKASTGLSATALNQARLKIGEGINGFAAQSGKPVALRDAAKDARFKFLPETQEQRFKSLLAVPLISHGQVIGTMNVRNTTFHRWTRPEIELLALIGDLAAGALERAALNDGLQRQVQELSGLAQVSQTITAPIYQDEMLRVVVEMAAQVMRARATALLLFDQERGELVLRATHGLSRKHVAASPLQVRSSLTGQVVMRGEPVVVRDLTSDPLYQNRELAKQEGLLSFLSVPLRVRDKIIGAFNCYLDTVHDFDRKEIELFSTLANQTALALENANLAVNSMLVREMHHRVKNNLQMIAMLLRLQLREGRQVTPREVLHQTINRILSIAAVHEALSQEGFRLIGVKGLIQQAAFVATQNMLRAGQEIQVLIDGADIRLPSQPATTLAIAANELIQNALEHGFGDRTGGTVQVRLVDEDGQFGLEVSDDGIGLPPGFDLKESLGLQIVQTLATEDLQGSFEVGGNPNGIGTRATLRLPKLAVAKE